MKWPPPQCITANVFWVVMAVFSIMLSTGTQGFTDRNSSTELGGGVVQLVKFPGASAVSIRNHLPGRIWRSQDRWTGLFHTAKLPPSVSAFFSWEHFGAKILNFWYFCWLQTILCQCSFLLEQLSRHRLYLCGCLGKVEETHMLILR